MSKNINHTSAEVTNGKVRTKSKGPGTHHTLNLDEGALRRGYGIRRYADSILIQNGTTEIPFCGLKDTDTDEIVFPSSMKRIGEKACDDSKVKRIMLRSFKKYKPVNKYHPEDDKIKTIGRAAFRGCRNIEHFEIGESLEEIKNFAFENSSIDCLEQLQQLQRKSGVKVVDPSKVKIGPYAFGIEHLG